MKSQCKIDALAWQTLWSLSVSVYRYSERKKERKKIWSQISRSLCVATKPTKAKTTHTHAHIYLYIYTHIQIYIAVYEHTERERKTTVLRRNKFCKAKPTMAEPKTKYDRQLRYFLSLALSSIIALFCPNFHYSQSV